MPLHTETEKKQVNQLTTLKRKLTVSPRQRRKKLIELNLCIKNVKFKIKIESARLLNATGIASGYAGRDPQGGKAIETFSVFF